MLKRAVLLPTNLDQLKNTQPESDVWDQKNLPFSYWNEIVEAIEFLNFRKISVTMIANMAFKNRFLTTLNSSGLDIEFLMIENCKIEFLAAPVDLMQQMANLFIEKENEVLLITKKDGGIANIFNKENTCFLFNGSFNFENLIDFKKSIFELLILD